jgi:hypothetical protein
MERGVGRGMIEDVWRFSELSSESWELMKICLNQKLFFVWKYAGLN